MVEPSVPKKYGKQGWTLSAGFDCFLGCARLRLWPMPVSSWRAGTTAPGRENLDLVNLPNASHASGRVAAAHVQDARG